MKANFETGLKTCACCRKELPISEFGICNNKHCSSDGLARYCKECERNKKKAAYEKNKERILKGEIKEVKMKVCPKCKRELPAENFYRSFNTLNGLSNQCIECSRKIQSENQKNKYRFAIKPEIKEKQCAKCNKVLSIDNFGKDRNKKDGYNAYCKQCAREKGLNYEQKYRDEGHLTEMYKQKRKSDPYFRLLCNLRSRVQQGIKRQFTSKSCKTNDLIGCSWNFLVRHLESQFQEGMSWENYKRGGWAVDHIIPCSYFDLTDPIQQRICFNFRNLQPLWESINSGIKRDQVPENAEELISTIKKELGL